MNAYRITANGHDFGIYEAASAADALDSYARDAGYKSYADVAEQFGDEAIAEEITDAA